ncbi:hypothetical protein AcV5_000257 [Taiwanofungus camphoratus]|nr:hypothetical protein AcV5_000257 [Antrodia cinnamomea]
MHSKFDWTISLVTVDKYIDCVSLTYKSVSHEPSHTCFFGPFQVYTIICAINTILIHSHYHNHVQLRENFGRRFPAWPRASCAFCALTPSVSCAPIPTVDRNIEYGAASKRFCLGLCNSELPN